MMYMSAIFVIKTLSLLTFNKKANSNSLIIQKKNTKEINVLWLFGNQMKNCSFLHPQFLLVKSFCLGSNIKHLTQCFINRWSTSKFMKNTPLCVIFSTLFSVFHQVVKHWISCLIYYSHRLWMLVCREDCYFKLCYDRMIQRHYALHFE